MNTSKVWYVTGASQGFGLTLVKNCLIGATVLRQLHVKRKPWARWLHPICR